MKNDSIKEIKPMVSIQSDQQLIEKLTVLEKTEELVQDELLLKASLIAELEERHGRSELEHIQDLIKNKLVA